MVKMKTLKHKEPKKMNNNNNNNKKKKKKKPKSLSVKRKVYLVRYYIMYITNWKLAVWSLPYRSKLELLKFNI